jgi:hypothetical protein
MMSTEPFLRVQELINARNSEKVRWLERLLISEFDNLLDIDFYGDPAGKAFVEILSVLRNFDIAPRLRTLNFHSPDLGANGTRDWDFGSLIGSDAIFPNLLRLSIELYDGTGANHPIISWAARHSFYESGTLANWLRKAPRLQF